MSKIILRKKKSKSNNVSDDPKYTAMASLTTEKVTQTASKTLSKTNSVNKKEPTKRNFKSIDIPLKVISEVPTESKETSNLREDNQKLTKESEQPKDNNNCIKDGESLSNILNPESPTQEDIVKKEYDTITPKSSSNNKSLKLPKAKIKGDKISKEPKTNGLSVNNKAVPQDDISLSIFQDLEREPWFHGILSRDDIKNLLTTSGSFLVRTDINNAKEKKLMLSCKWNSKRIHFVFEIKGREVMLFDQRSISVSCLINKVVNEKIPLHPEYKVILQKPILQQPWEINKNNINFIKKIGQGTFGDIWKGTMKTATDQGYNTPIAIKIPKIKNLDKFISIITEALLEVKFMRLFEHENIVKFYGSSFSSEPFMIVMELSNYGCLQRYVRRKKKKLENKDLLKFAIDAALGVDYIHSKCGIHRDVAARNCLVFSENKVKISDFGQAIILKNGEKEFKLYSKDSLLPLRWLSPETLAHSIFSYKTDVYSFGILLWELFNACKEPFATLTVGEIVTGVKSGLKPKSLPTVPMEIIDIIENKCLHSDPTKRPSMNELTKILTDIYSRTIQPLSESK
uniref:Tyrosine-protein kinase n=1 Tax=Strongyloides papillosus TaxID=174720 RepID=A0A0N5B6T2_STREA